MNKRFGWFVALFILLSACTAAVPVETTVVETPSGEIDSLAAPTAVPTEKTAVETPSGEIDSLAAPTAVAPTAAPPNTPDQPTLNRRVVTDEAYQVSILIPFDGIRPIYEPVFVAANEATYQDDELVMGVAWGNEAKAYPVTVLRFREMVNDELAGIPILVTW